MNRCNKAKKSLEKTGLEIMATSVLWGWVTNDLRTTSILSTAWDLTKNQVKNDKETQKNIGTFISCHFGF